MGKKGKLSWHACGSRLSVSSVLIAFVISFVATTTASLYADEMPYGDRMSTLVIRSTRPRDLSRAQQNEGPRVLVKDLAPKLTPPFSIDVIDPGNDGSVLTLGDEDGDDRTAANPFINGFDLRNATATFNDLHTITVKIRLAKCDNNGLTPAQVGSTSADPCYGGAFTQNVRAFNADPPATTDYFGWNHITCVYAATANIISGDTDPDTDANEVPAFQQPNDAPDKATSTEEFYDFIVEQPPGVTIVLNVRVTGRTPLNLDKQIANLVTGDSLITINLESSGTNLWDYTNENELNFVISNIPNNAGDPNTGGPFFDPAGAFKVRINANSSADGPGEDQEERQVTTTTSTTTTTTTTTSTTTTSTTTTSTTTTTTSTTTTTTSTTTTSTSTTTTSTSTTTTSTTTTSTTTTSTSTTSTSTTTTSTSTTSTSTSTTSTSTRIPSTTLPVITHPKGTIIYGVLLMAAGVAYMLWRRRR